MNLTVLAPWSWCSFTARLGFAVHECVPPFQCCRCGISSVHWLCLLADGKLKSNCGQTLSMKEILCGAKVFRMSVFCWSPRPPHHCFCSVRDHVALARYLASSVCAVFVLLVSFFVHSVALCDSLLIVSLLVFFRALSCSPEPSRAFPKPLAFFFVSSLFVPGC
jgi:hypothetical protein